MAPKQNPRIGKAFRAMKEYEFSEDVVKPVLKNLLRISDKNWDFIEHENYTVLIDAIFEAEEEKNRKATDNDVPHEPEQPLKRQRPSHEGQNLFSNEDGNGTSSGTGTSLQGANLNSEIAVADIDPQPLQAVMEPLKPPVCITDPMDESEPDSPPSSLRLRDRRLTSSKALVIAEASDSLQPWTTDEGLHFSQMGLEDELKENVSPEHSIDEERTYSESSRQLLDSKDTEIEPRMIPNVVTDTYTFIKIKTEPEVSEAPTEGLAINVFPPETIIEMCGTDPTSFVDDVRMDSFSLMDDGISTRGNQAGECFSGAQSISNGRDTEEDYVRVGNSANDAVNKVVQPETETLTSFCNSDNGTTDAVSLIPEDLAISARTNGMCTSVHPDEGGTTDNLIENVKEKEVIEETTGKPVSINTNKGNQTGTKETTYLLDATDITKGEEKLKISIVNHFNDVPPPSFCYIHQSLVGQNAVVNISLAQIGNKDCCQNCVGDCLSLKEPRTCACTIGERCVYASDGTLNEKFLEQNISMTCHPKKHRQFFCEDCPLEVGTDKDALKPCQGHLVRNVVKECWLKCHCNHNCTNRRVQRGISYKLQVFMTSGGKGWGLRTLEDLPKGAFVCEYVGEILTLSELYLRYKTSLRYCAYTMILDAGWASSKEIKENKDKPLCLDASVYGNVARFINHRCTDANLVVIPVSVETSDHLYHRIAFFTSRKVAALEELTRDYGTNFDDIDGVTRPFRCRCGSSFCRNFKRYNRKRLKDNSPKPLISRENL